MAMLPGYQAPSLGDRLQQAGQHIANVVTNKAQDVAGALVEKGTQTLGALVNGINKVLPSILPTATAALATLSFRGTQGTLVSIHEDIVLYATFIYTQGLDRENRGTPVYRRFEPRELSGFAQFRDVHIPTENGMTINEAEAIETLLQSGVYLEWGGMD